MTINEAQKILKILKEADSGCEGCVTVLVKLAYKNFPEHLEVWKTYRPWYEEEDDEAD